MESVRGRKVSCSCLNAVNFGFSVLFLIVQVPVRNGQSVHSQGNFRKIALGNCDLNETWFSLCSYLTMLLRLWSNITDSSYTETY